MSRLSFWICVWSQSSFGEIEIFIWVSTILLEEPELTLAVLCFVWGGCFRATHRRQRHRKLVISHKNVNHAAYLPKRWVEYILRSLECSRSSQQWDPSIHFPHCGDKSKVLRGIIGFEFAQILKVGYHFKIILMPVLLDTKSPDLCFRVLGFNAIVIISKVLFVPITAKKHIATNCNHFNISLSLTFDQMYSPFISKYLNIWQGLLGPSHPGHLGWPDRIYRVRQRAETTGQGQKRLFHRHLFQ